MLYVSNAGLGNGVSREHVYVWLSEFGKLQDIIMLDRKPYCLHHVEHFIFFVQEGTI